MNATIQSLIHDYYIHQNILALHCSAFTNKKNTSPFIPSNIYMDELTI